MMEGKAVSGGKKPKAHHDKEERSNVGQREDKVSVQDLEEIWPNKSKARGGRRWLCHHDDTRG